MASFLDIERNNLVPLSVNCLCARPCLPLLSRKTLNLLPRYPKLKNLALVLNRSKVGGGGGAAVAFPLLANTIFANRHLIAAVARAEPDRPCDDNAIQQKVL